MIEQGIRLINAKVAERIQGVTMAIKNPIGHPGGTFTEVNLRSIHVINNPMATGILRIFKILTII